MNDQTSGAVPRPFSTGGWIAGFALLAAAQLAAAGCHSTQNAPRLGDRLPVTSTSSVALPGAVDAADAPRSPDVAEPRTDNLVEYRDPAHGVSFQYPSVWRPASGTGYLGSPDFASVAPTPLVMQQFTSKGTYYAGTVLQALSFSYTVKQHSTQAECASLPGKALGNSADKPISATYNGFRYTEDKGGDAGMCHHLSATVDTVLNGTTCYLFERDTMTGCPYTESRTRPRPLTASEQTALQRHLNAIMDSVQIGKTQ